MRFFSVNIKKHPYYFLLIVIIGLIVLNILSDKIFFRLDFTADKRYTLSHTTRTMLHDLKKPVTITAYFSKDLPTELQQVRKEFEEKLQEYASRSNHKVRYSFVDPSGSDKAAQQAQQAGIQPVPAQTTGNDQVKIQNVYLGAVVAYDSLKEVIPVIASGAGMEYALTLSIKKLSTVNKPTIGILQGQGEPSLGSMRDVYAGLSIMYNIEPIYLNDTSYTLFKYKTIAVIAPSDSLKPAFIRQLDRYLSQGGNLFLALDHVRGNLQTLTGTVLNTGLEGWLKEKGITLEDNCIIDERCGSVSVPQQGFYVNLQFPYLPIVGKFAEHPATDGLKEVMLQFASSIKLHADASHILLPLAQTSGKSGTASLPFYMDVNRQWSDDDFKAKELVVAALMQPKNKNSVEGKAIVVGNGDFVVNGEGESERSLMADNVSLMINSIDYLSDDSGLAELRTKEDVPRLLNPVEEGTKTFLKIFNFLLPILIIIGFGIYRYNRNRRTRQRRMETGRI